MVLNALFAEYVIAGLVHDGVRHQRRALPAAVEPLIRVQDLDGEGHCFLGPGLVPLQSALLLVDLDEVVFLSDISELVLEHLVLVVQFVHLLELLFRLDHVRLQL